MAPLLHRAAIIKRKLNYARWHRPL